jgi:hypothetical protein
MRIAVSQIGAALAVADVRSATSSAPRAIVWCFIGDPSLVLRLPDYAYQDVG